MIKFKTKVTLLKAVVDSLFSLHEETTIEVKPEGIKFKTMDASHWSLVVFNWRKEDFVSYQCDEEIRFGFRVDDFSKILKRFNKEEEVEVEKLESVGLLRISSGPKHYEIRLMAPSTLFDEIKEETRAVFTAKFETTIQDIASMIDDIGIVDNSFKFIVENNDCFCTSTGDSSKVNLVFKANVEGKAEGLYDIELFQGIIKSLSSLATKAVLHLGTDSPIKLEIFLSETMILTYMLAPRIKN